MRANLLAWSVALTIIALLYARWEYRKRGRLSPFGLVLLCGMLFVPNLMIHYLIDYGISGNVLDLLGIALGVAGLLLCFTGIGHFHSTAKVFCLDAGELALTGPYRFGRNPQYLGFLAFLFGVTLTGWDWWCLLPLTVQATNLHLLVLVEEEHLRRVFGQAYIDFCKNTPRYWGLARR